MTASRETQLMVGVACDLCGQDDPQVRYPLRLGAIVSCRACGFSYVNPRLPSEVLHRKLQEWAEQDVVDDERLRVAFEPSTMDFYRAYYDSLEPHVRTPGRRQLDVGCATGALLSVGRDRHWEVEGVELGKASARYASDVLGMRIHNESLYEFTPTGPYDLVSFLEVIEHLEHPAKALAHLHGLLREDGLLLLSTPNFDSLYRRLFGTDWWVVNCEDEHIMFFTPKSIRFALEQAGFEVLELRTRSIDLAGLFKTFKSRLRPSAGTAVPSDEDDHGYYAARDGKEAVKAWLKRAGILTLTRKAMHGLDTLFSRPWSPLFGLGEQLVVIARRK